MELAGKCCSISGEEWPVPYWFAWKIAVFSSMRVIVKLRQCLTEWELLVEEI